MVIFQVKWQVRSHLWVTQGKNSMKTIDSSLLGETTERRKSKHKWRPLQEAQEAAISSFQPVPSQPHSVLAGGRSVVPSRKCSPFLATAIAMTANREVLAWLSRMQPSLEGWGRAAEVDKYLWVTKESIPYTRGKNVSSTFEVGTIGYTHVEEQNSIHTFHSG